MINGVKETVATGKKENMKTWTIAAAGLVCAAISSSATTFNSDGTDCCGPSSVQAIHDAQTTRDGDTITIPGGTFTWATQVHITKNITIEGAGQDVTIVYDNVPKAAAGDGPVMLLATGITSTFRITGFTVRGMAQDTNNLNKGIIVVYGDSHSVRIDHVKIDQPGTGAMRLGLVWGVVDHCYFNEPNHKIGVEVGAANFGDESFETPTNLGSGEGVYVEDNTFIGNALGGASAVNAVAGGRVVFRHNTLIDQNTAGHGTEGTRQRGMRTYEIYQNTFTTSHLMDKGIQLRGGTGVIWGNTLRGTGGSTGYENAIVALNFRSFTQYNQNFGSATGSNSWDQNTDTTGYACIDQVGMGLCLDAIRNNPPVNQRTGSAALAAPAARAGLRVEQFVDASPE